MFILILMYIFFPLSHENADDVLSI